MNYSRKTLEFDKILSKVEPYAVSHRAKDAILNMDIYTNLDLIEEKLLEQLDCETAILRSNNIPLEPTYDILETLKRLDIKAVLTPQELVLVKKFLYQEYLLDRYLKRLKGLELDLPNLYKYLENIHIHKDLYEEVKLIIDDDAIILDSASKNLFIIRRKMESKEKEIDVKLDKIMNRYEDFLNEKIVVMRNNRYCIAVKDTFKNKIKGTIHDMSASQQTAYVEPAEISQIMADLDLLKLEEETEIQRILAKISDEIGLELETLGNNLEIFLELDIIFSKANYGISIQATKPKINKNQHILLKKARHPLIAPEEIVPIDFKLEKKAPTMIITGPNTGGKTVALKTVGLMTLMTQAGMLIPALEGSEVAIYENVYADIGDEQSLEQSLSTFSGHLTKIIKIIENVSKDDLVLIDELGSGTDPMEGTALAIAILNYLRSKAPSLLVTTHYQELKRYAFSKDDIITASVAFDEETLAPLYYLQIGLTGSSNAILIASRLGLDKDIIEDSKKIMAGKKDDSYNLLEKVSKKEQELLNKEQELSLKETELKDKINKYENLLNENAKEQERVIDELVRQEQEVWNKKHLEMNRLIKELKKKNELSFKDEAKLKEKMKRPDQTVEIVTDYDFKVGDYVYIKPYDQTGKITKIKDEVYTVDLGPFSLKFKKADLLLTKAPKAKPKKKTSKRRKGVEPARKSIYELDLRGARYDEVAPLLDKAIDDLLLSGLNSLKIIHGYGTGAVRDAVYKYINNSSQIKEHRYGGEKEGMRGVTFITLK